MSFLRNPVLVRVCQVLIGLVFVAAALPKIGDPASFVGAVHNFRVAPIFAENLIAMTLPWIELVAGVVLILDLGGRGRAGGLVAFALMAVFTLGVAQAMARGLNFSCGCFGTADGTKVGLLKLAENVGLTAIAAVASVRR